MSVLQPPKGLATCPHCRFNAITASALDQHLRFQCITLGRTDKP